MLVAKFRLDAVENATLLRVALEYFENELAEVDLLMILAILINWW